MTVTSCSMPLLVLHATGHAAIAMLQPGATLVGTFPEGICPEAAANPWLGLACAGASSGTATGTHKIQQLQLGHLMR